MVSLRGGDVPASLAGEDQLPAIEDLSLKDSPPTTTNVATEDSRKVPAKAPTFTNGHLRALKTKEEVRAEVETFDAYVIQLQSRHAAAIKE